MLGGGVLTVLGLFNPLGPLGIMGSMSMAIEGDRSRPATQLEQAQGRIGWFLVWAVVFADLGTSVYYAPGILFSHPSVGRHTALFVALSLLVFVLLTRKYAEVAVRYPGGGGVVTVSTE